MKRILLAIILAAVLSYGAFNLIPKTPDFACVPLPAHTPLATRHGNDHWSDDKLRVYSAMRSGVEIPVGWQAVGANQVVADCALFPPHQSVVFIKPEHWRTETLKGAKAGLDIRRIALKSTSDADLAKMDTKIIETFKNVASLFPLGFKADQKALPHDILVTIGMAGDMKSDATRIYPAPGPNLSSLFYSLDNNRGTDLFIHAIAHFYNKQRARTEVAPNEADLPMVDYREFVASWAELAFNHNHKYVKKRVKFLKRQHVLLTDNDPDTWPTYRAIKAIQAVQGPFGVPPTNHPAAIEYTHYYLSPLILLGMDGLLASDAPDISVKMMLKEIHAGKSPGLLSSIEKYMPMRARQIQTWMTGKKQIPLRLINKGLVRLHSGGNEGT